MPSTIAHETVVIPVAQGRLTADLRVPAGAHGLVVFAHGSGSSRLSVRNQSVAEYLGGRGFATVLLDLLTRDEDAVDAFTSEYRFDVERLGARVAVATDWLGSRDDLRRLPLGYFGASTGAAAALIGAAARPRVVQAVVSRGGRPDLAGLALGRVEAPTLLIVGGLDEPVIELNREAMAQMHAPVDLQIVPGATHLFEEPGALEHVMVLAGGWFERHLAG